MQRTGVMWPWDINFLNNSFALKIWHILYNEKNIPTYMHIDPR